METSQKLSAGAAAAAAAAEWSDHGRARRRAFGQRADAGRVRGPQFDGPDCLRRLQSVEVDSLERARLDCAGLIERCVDMRWSGFDVDEIERELKWMLRVLAWVLQKRNETVRVVANLAVGPYYPTSRQLVILEGVEYGNIILREPPGAVGGGFVFDAGWIGGVGVGRSIELLIEHGLMWKDEYGYLAVTVEGSAAISRQYSKSE